VAFGTIVNSLVNDILMPPLGLAIGNVDFSDLFIVLKSGVDGSSSFSTLTDAKTTGAVTLNYGMFVNNIVNFIIVAISVFIVVKGINKLKRKEVPSAPNTKNCPYCQTAISIKATRCPNCTSQLVAA